MKQLMLALFALFVLSLAAPPGYCAVVPGASAFVLEPDASFGTVAEGNRVDHTFAVENRGDATLRILGVKSGWGCTVVDYDREIPPGGEGKIAVKINTLGYGGRVLVQQIKVHTNQTGNPLTLKVSGRVEKIATITPEVVHFTGAPGENLVATVSILPSDRYDFSLKDQVIPAMKNVEAVLKLSGTREKAWDLVVTNTRKTTGRYYEVITLETDSKAQPELKIRVFGNLNAGNGAAPHATGP